MKFESRAMPFSGETNAPALEPFLNKDSSLVLQLLGTVNGELKLLQNRSKKRFWGKRTTIYHKQGIMIYIHSQRYIAIGEANGKSTTIYYKITPATQIVWRPVVWHFWLCPSSEKGHPTFLGIEIKPLTPRKWGQNMNQGSMDPPFLTGSMPN